jgi:hypothetical protein
MNNKIELLHKTLTLIPEEKLILLISFATDTINNATMEYSEILFMDCTG